MTWITASEDFNKAFDTYVIAYSIDNDEFFVTNERCWWWQYDKEFRNEQEGIKYFEDNIVEFKKIAEDLRKCGGLKLKNEDLFLANTNKLYTENGSKVIGHSNVITINPCGHPNCMRTDCEQCWLNKIETVRRDEIS